MSAIYKDGDCWEIQETGAWRDGRVYCRLSSTTRGRQQRNGFCPIQMADWIEEAMVEKARHRPAGFYRWNRSIQGAFERGERDAAEGVTECPYPDRRNPRGGITWARSYRSAWFDGAKHYSEGRP